MNCVANELEREIECFQHAPNCISQNCIMSASFGLSTSTKLLNFYSNGFIRILISVENYVLTYFVKKI